MVGHRLLRLPGILVVAPLAVETHHVPVGVLMASAAASGRIDFRRTPVIMAAQADGLSVGAFQGIARFLEMVKLEFRTQKNTLLSHVSTEMKMK